MSNNPKQHAILTASADEFAERRGFERVYHQDPRLQASAAKFLIGTIARHSEFGPASENSPEVIEAARVLLKDFVERFPEFMQTEYKCPNEVGGGIYSVNPLLERLVKENINEE